MKRTFLLIIVILLGLCGCVTTGDIPPENVWFGIRLGNGERAEIFMEKGFLNKDQEGENWMTDKEYQKLWKEKQAEKEKTEI